MNRHRLISFVCYFGSQVVGGVGFLVLGGSGFPRLAGVLGALGAASMLTGMTMWFVGGRCPRCKHRLAFAGPGGVSWRLPRKMGFCPWCGISIDLSDEPAP